MIALSMLKLSLTISFLLTFVLAATTSELADAVKDAPPSETSPTAPTRPGTVANCDRWYTAKANDTCDGITRSFGISLDDFYNWNPSLKKNCETNFWANYAYCVGVSKATQPASTGTNTNTASTTTTIPSTNGGHTSSSNASSPSTSTLFSSSAAQTSNMPSSSVPVIPTSGSTSGSYSIINPISSFTPTPKPSSIDDSWPPAHTQTGQPESCYKWHLVQKGDTCDTIQARYSAWLSFEELLEWNPGLAEDCEYPFLGWWVCVATQRAPVTYSYPPDNATSISVPEPTSHSVTVFPTDLPTLTPSPTQSGLAPSCQAYYQAEKDDTCKTIVEQYYYLTEKLLHDWNPALQDDCSGLRDQYYYCVAAFPEGQAPMPPTVTASPSPVASDATKECTAWYKASEFDTCPLLVLRFGTFEARDFISWNPSVGKECTDIIPSTWYCVAVKDTPTTRTESFPTSLPTSLYPRQPNIIKTCTFFWPVEKDETCDYIAYSNGIPLAQFIAWNPDVVDSAGECKNLIPNYEVCVEAPAPASSMPTSGFITSSVQTQTSVSTPSITSKPMSTLTIVEGTPTPSAQK